MRRGTDGPSGPLSKMLGGLTLAVTLGGTFAWANEGEIPENPNPPLERVSPVLRQAWDAFRARHGDDWTVQWDFAAAVPRKLYGPGIDMTDLPLDGPTVDALARTFLSENRGLYRVDELVLSGRPTFAGTVWYLNYQLAYRGVPLDEASRLDFRFKPNGTLAMVAAYHLPRRFEPTLDADVPVQAAIFTAESTLPDVGGPYHLKADPILQLRVNKNAVAQLVWRFELRNDRQDLPIARDFSVHAVGDAEILESRQRVFEVDVTGNVKANAHVGPPGTAVVAQNLANIRVELVGGAITFTDANGNFTLPNAGTSNVTVRVGNTTSAFTGAFARTSNLGGANTLFSTTATPGTPLNVVLNATPAEFTNAEADGFLQTTRTHDLVRSIIGPFGLESPMLVRVNDPNNCNAYYDGASTNFFRAGNGCNNTAYDSVCAHEYGHAIDDAIGSITDGGLSEGIGDIVSMYMLDDPIIGRNFLTNGGSIRDGNNTRQWPASECGNEPHCVGEVIMGTVWQIRQNLRATLGDPLGLSRSNQIVFGALLGNGPGSVDYLLDIYMQDDDDGNVNNGVPDQSDLDAAADFHNMPHPSPVFITITHTPLAATTTNSSVPYAVVANITTVSGAISAATVRYSVNGAAYQSVAMAPTANPDEYQGGIPAQACGSSVNYYVQASDTASHTASLPLTAPAQSFSFSVGLISRFFIDDFEPAGDNGWTHSTVVGGQDDWQHGSPNQQGNNPWDPLVAYSGLQVWGNDLNPSGFNGDYRNNNHNELLSPSINTVGRNGVHLRYRRWLTVEDGFYDQARILVNGTQVWQNPVGSGTDQFLDASWVDHDIDISAQADNRASVQLTFTIDSDPGLQFGGWNIDDVSLQTVAGGGALSMSVSDTTPSIGQLLTISFNGTSNQQVVLLTSRMLGNATFQIPNGPLVTTGLGSDVRQRGATTLNASGVGMISRNVPVNPALIGRTFQTQAFLNACAGAGSNVIALVVQP